MASAILRKKNDDGSYTYQLRHYKGKGKRLVKDWTSPAGVSKRTIERELQKQLRLFEHDCEEGVVITRKEKKEIERKKAERIISFKNYSENVFLPTVDRERSEGTRYYYHNTLKRLYSYFGDIDIDQINAPMITEVLGKLKDLGYSKSTIHGTIVGLNQLFKLAGRNGICKNPMPDVYRPKWKKSDNLGKQNGPKAFTIDEVHRILQYINENMNLKWQAYIWLSIDTGARKSELLGLQWSDIDFKAGTITIRRIVCHSSDKGTYIDTPKTEHGFRVIDVAPNVLHLLLQLRSEAHLNRSINILTKNSYVFHQWDGSPMSPSTPNIMMNKMKKELGFKSCTPHMLRHTLASIAITNGADIASISEKLGHAKKSITLDMYTHADAEAIKKAGDVFRNAIGGF